MRDASFLTFPSPPLNYRSYVGTTNPKISKAENHRDCFFHLSVERSAMASLLISWCLGQKTSPYLGLTYPLAEGEKQES